MGQLKYIKRDLFLAKNPIICHGCNIAGGFGSGIAGLIASKFPEVKRAYKNKFYREGFKLGDIQIVPLWEPKGDTKIIVNLMTQAKYGGKSIQVNYEACFEAFVKLFAYAAGHLNSIAMPKIGTGLGNGQWQLVEEQLMKALAIHEVNVDVYYL